jgi:hypothetical protein
MISSIEMSFFTVPTPHTMLRRCGLRGERCPCRYYLITKRIEALQT